MVVKITAQVSTCTATTQHVIAVTHQPVPTVPLHACFVTVNKAATRHCRCCCCWQVLGDEAPPAAAMARSLSSGGLTLVSGGPQWEAVMEGLPRSTLLVALFGLSGDPICQATADAVRVRLRGGWLGAAACQLC
jgi:hypothetical protein